jgi:hypothetical protein
MHFLVNIHINNQSILYKVNCVPYFKLLMESCHTFIMEKIVIGLWHFWHAHMVCVDWVQHPVN